MHHRPFRRLLTVLTIAFLAGAALAETVRFEDPDGRFALEHPERWHVEFTSPSLELYGEPFATFVQVAIVPGADLPSGDAEQLSRLIRDGAVEGWEEVERFEPERVVVDGLPMVRSAFAGIDATPVRSPREGAVYAAMVGGDLVMVVITLPSAVAEEVRGELEAVLASLTIAR